MKEAWQSSQSVLLLSLHSSSSSSYSSSFPSTLPLCRQLSVIRYFPPSNAPPTLGFQLRKRRRFYRHWAELSRHFETVNDGLAYQPFVEVADRDKEEGKFSVAVDRSLDEQNEDVLAFLREENPVVIERVHSDFAGSSSNGQIVEFRVDLYRAALAYLVDAFRCWELYGNFPLHYRLAPLKVVVVLRESDASDEKVAAVAQYIREYLVMKNKLCDIRVIADDAYEAAAEGEEEEDDDDDEESCEIEKRKKTKEIKPNEMDVDPSKDFRGNKNLRTLMSKNGGGVPFIISIDKSMMEHGVLKVYERETRTAEHLHLFHLGAKLVDYLNGLPFESVPRSFNKEPV